MSTLAPSRGSNTTHLPQQPPTRNLDNPTPALRAPAPPAPKSPDHVKRKQSTTMSTTLSPPKETTTTVTQTTVTQTTQTHRVRTLMQSIWRRLRPVPGSLRPQDHMDPVHWHYGTVHPMHLR